MTKLLGLIGGMSWQTTSIYYREINQRINTRLGGIHSANLLIRSLDYAMIAKFVSSGDFDSMAQLLCGAGNELKAAGAQGLVLCANVAHKASDAVEASTGLPVLHIVDFTGRKIVQAGFKKVGLLATRAVMEQDFYKARLRDKFGLEVFVPQDPKFRADADRQIFEEMSKDVIPEEVTTAWHSAFSQLVNEDQVDCVILGCTELRLLFDPEKMDVPVFETTILHAQGVADWALDSENGSINSL